MKDPTLSFEDTCPCKRCETLEERLRRTMEYAREKTSAIFLFNSRIHSLRRRLIPPPYPWWRPFARAAFRRGVRSTIITLESISWDLDRT